MPLEYSPRTQSIYSDLGFILLGFIAEDRGRAPLDRQFDDLMPATDLLAVRRARGRPRAHRADEAGAERCSARSDAHRRGARRLRRRARRRRRTRGIVRVGRRRAVVRACRAARGTRRPERARSLLHGADRAGDDGRARSPTARARSGGTRCCPLRRAEPRCRRRPSDTSGSPARRCGSIRSAIATSSCSPIESGARGTIEQMRDVRRAFHNALAAMCSTDFELPSTVHSRDVPDRCIGQCRVGRPSTDEPTATLTDLKRTSLRARLGALTSYYLGNEGCMPGPRPPGWIGGTIGGAPRPSPRPGPPRPGGPVPGGSGPGPPRCPGDWRLDRRVVQGAPAPGAPPAPGAAARGTWTNCHSL